MGDMVHYGSWLLAELAKQGPVFSDRVSCNTHERADWGSIVLQLDARRAEAAKWHELQAAKEELLSERERLLAELAEYKALYETEASRASELQASANRLQTELTRAQLELQVRNLWWCNLYHIG